MLQMVQKENPTVPSSSIFLVSLWDLLMMVIGLHWITGHMEVIVSNRKWFIALQNRLNDFIEQFFCNAWPFFLMFIPCWYSCCFFKAFTKLFSGLRTIFPLFMRTPSKQKRKDSTPDEHEEHVCSVKYYTILFMIQLQWMLFYVTSVYVFIDLLAQKKTKILQVLASLLRSCGEEGRNRIFSKFSEHEYEKVDRAVELVLKYQ